MLLFRQFLQDGSAPPQTLPSFDYDAPEEVYGDTKWFDRPLQKKGLKQIFGLDSRRALTLFSLPQAAAFGYP